MLAPLYPRTEATIASYKINHVDSLWWGFSWPRPQSPVSCKPHWRKRRTFVVQEKHLGQLYNSPTGRHTLSMVYYSLIPKLGSGSETMVHLRWKLFQVLHITLQ